MHGICNFGLSCKIQWTICAYINGPGGPSVYAKFGTPDPFCIHRWSASLNGPPEGPSMSVHRRIMHLSILCPTTSCMGRGGAKHGIWLHLPRNFDPRGGAFDKDCIAWSLHVCEFLWVLQSCWFLWGFGELSYTVGIWSRKTSSKYCKWCNFS